MSRERSGSLGQIRPREEDENELLRYFKRSATGRGTKETEKDMVEKKERGIEGMFRSIQEDLARMMKGQTEVKEI